MTKLSANRAAKEAGVAKKTLLEALTSGRLSADKNDKGHWEIDPAELFRVFPKTSGVGGEETVSHPPEKTSENNVIKVELEVLKQRMKDAQDTIEDLRTRLTKSDEERTRLTLMLTGPEKATGIAKQEEVSMPTEKRLTLFERLTGRVKG